MIDKDSEFTEVIQFIHQAINCQLKIISTFNHDSSRTKRQIQTMGNMIPKHLIGKGEMLPLYTAIAAYAMNTFSSPGLSGFSPDALVLYARHQTYTTWHLLYENNLLALTKITFNN